MTIIELNKRLYAVPTQWNELTRRQLLQVIKVFYSEKPIEHVLLNLARIITGISWIRFFLAPIEELEEFIYLTHFMIKENSLTRQLITSYRSFYGPADDFNNITGDEFVFSEDQYFCYVNSKKKDQAALDNLVSILFRPSKELYDHKLNKDGDARIAFNENICRFYADRKISKWPEHVKLAIFHWYEACREKMIKDNPQVFSGGSGEPARYGLISVMRTIAEGGIHGDFEKVSGMYVKMWMVELNEKIEEAKRIEQSVK